MLGKKRYFISFIEEFWPHQKPGTTMGRVEVYKDDGGAYAVEEIRFGTEKIKEFWRFREKYDFRHYHKKGVDKIRRIIEEKFLPKVNNG